MMWKDYIKEKIFKLSEKLYDGYMISGNSIGSVKEVERGNQISKEALDNIIYRLQDYYDLESGIHDDLNFEDYDLT